MRRADDRRSASVMISNSIRWSLAGNDVDWMMKASEPRTFSWISTKISMSAKRRTTALVSGRLSPPAMACARDGLELPATSLMEPFLADIEASPRALLATTFSISGYPWNRLFSQARRYQGECAAGNPSPRFSRAKMAVTAAIWLMIGVAERGQTRPGWGEFSGIRNRGPAFVRRGRGRGSVLLRRAVDHVGEAAQACLRDLAQHEIIGGGPGIAAGFAGGLFAGEAQRALLVAVIDVPHPGDHGLATHDLRGEIGAHAVAGRALARDDGKAAQLALAVEHADQPVEHLRRRTIDLFEGDRRAVARARHRKGAARSACRAAIRATAERAGRGKKQRGKAGAARVEQSD